MPERVRSGGGGEGHYLQKYTCCREDGSLDCEEHTTCGGLEQHKRHIYSSHGTRVKCHHHHNNNNNNNNNSDDDNDNHKQLRRLENSLSPRDKLPRGLQTRIQYELCYQLPNISDQLKLVLLYLTFRTFACGLFEAATLVMVRGVDDHVVPRPPGGHGGVHHQHLRAP